MDETFEDLYELDGNIGELVQFVLFVLFVREQNRICNT